jgi:ligand-binding SRPBCC domain-containing protein
MILMRLHTLKRQHDIGHPLDEVFLFFSKPENLSLITPKDLRFRLHTPSPIVMKEGALIDYAIRIIGIPIRWRTLIATFDPPYRFEDLQLRGPYLYWHHLHSFQATEHGTRMTDEVTYALPFGPLGEIVHSLLIERQLETIFDFRARALTDLFSGNRPRVEQNSRRPRSFGNMVPSS